MMEDNKKVQELQQQLEEAERNVHLAATYGKQLLKDNQDLHSQLQDTIIGHAKKVEALEQEKYALTSKLEVVLKTKQSLVQELEQQRDQHSAALQKTHTSHQQQLDKYEKKISELEGQVELKEVEVAQGREKVELLIGQLQEAQDRLEVMNHSIHETSMDDSTALLHTQVTTLTCEKQELEREAGQLRARLTTTQHTLAQTEARVTTLQKELEEKECQATSLFNALEKSKEEMMELRLELDNLHLEETDPARKGNSLFAEVEDHRRVLEKRLLTYKTNYDLLLKQCDIKTQQNAKLKLQVASLLSLSSCRGDGEYLQQLQESLRDTKAHLQYFITRCQELEAQQATLGSLQGEAGADTEDNNSFFKGLYMETHKTVGELREELRNAQFTKALQSDEILQLHRKLRQADQARDAAVAEQLRLSVRYEDLAAKKGVRQESEEKKIKRVVQKLPDFDTATSRAAAPAPTTPPSPALTPSAGVDITSSTSTTTPARPALAPSADVDITSSTSTTTPASPALTPSADVGITSSTSTTTPASPDTASSASSTPATSQLMCEVSSHLPEQLSAAITSPQVNRDTQHTGAVEQDQERIPSEDKENQNPVCPEQKKKPKKTVHLVENVMIQESDGRVQESKLKTTGGGGRMERKQVRRVMKPPPPAVTTTLPEDCKQQ